jgi:hypothetical protein
MILFRLSTPAVVLVVFGVIMSATALGLVVGRMLRERSDGFRESLGVIQAALLGFMGLVLAFGLSLAVGRYEARRAAVVTEANAIGTTYLRAQTLAEPMRSESLALLERYTDASLGISHTVPGSAAQKRWVAESGLIQRQLWNQAAAALNTAPDASAPRLYVETLNETFDAQTSRVAGLGNRVPTPVLVLELVGAAVALGLLALHAALLGRGVVTSILAAALVTLMLLVVFDLDRPTRGLIDVPSTALDQVRASMELGPSATGPPGP